MDTKTSNVLESDLASEHARLTHAMAKAKEVELQTGGTELHACAARALERFEAAQHDYSRDGDLERLREALNVTSRAYEHAAGLS